MIAVWFAPRTTELCQLGSCLNALSLRISAYFQKNQGRRGFATSPLLQRQLLFLSIKRPRKCGEELGCLQAFSEMECQKDGFVLGHFCCRSPFHYGRAGLTPPSTTPCLPRSADTARNAVNVASHVLYSSHLCPIDHPRIQVDQERVVACC